MYVGIVKHVAVSGGAAVCDACATCALIVCVLWLMGADGRPVSMQ